jgi:hypothetical protein
VLGHVVSSKCQRRRVPLILQDLKELVATRGKGLRRPAIVLLVVRELEERNAMPLAVAQELAAHRQTRVIIRASDDILHMLADLTRAALNDCKVGALSRLDSTAL